MEGLKHPELFNDETIPRLADPSTFSDPPMMMLNGDLYKETIPPLPAAPSLQTDTEDQENQDFPAAPAAPPINEALFAEALGLVEAAAAATKGADSLQTGEEDKAFTAGMLVVFLVNSNTQFGFTAKSEHGDLYKVYKDYRAEELGGEPSQPLKAEDP